MENFIGANFLLQSHLAERLYFDYAADLPIIDYHAHLSPQEIFVDRKFENITQIWLQGDHYKWRAMRVLGVDERFITGNANDREKFQHWAETVPYTLRNPLFHWTHMELKNPFGVSELLNGVSAEGIYNHTKECLQRDQFSSRGLLQHFNVEMVGTTDDPIDTLDAHLALGNSDFKTQVLPSFRPDRCLNIGGGDSFRLYISQLAAAAGGAIFDLDTLLVALFKRVDFFHAAGCRIADHGLGQLPLQGQVSTEEINRVLRAVLDGDDASASLVVQEAFAFYILSSLAKRYHQLGWVQQYHLGALRNNNKRLLQLLGPDTGFDSIGDYRQAVGLSNFLNHLDASDQLAKTIIYNLNPADNAVFATMAGNFQSGGIRGKIQFGSAWWFLDQLDGMEQQINTLSNMGLLSCFIGMLTDSRSFLSYSRHAYFRRLLCNIFARDVENGVLPNDSKWIGEIITAICYGNAKQYFFSNQET